MASGFTPYMAFATEPSGAITNVERVMPMDVFPELVVSPQTPYASAASWSGSASSVNGREYFSLKRTCEASSSGLTPRMTAPRSWKTSWSST